MGRLATRIPKSLQERAERADDRGVTNTFSEVESSISLLAGFQVRLEAGGVNAEGRVLSVGETIRVALISGARSVGRLPVGTPISLQFGGPGTLQVGDAEILAWEDDGMIVLSQPPAYSVWQRLIHPRFRVQVPISAMIGGDRGMTVEGETVDLSASGTACILPDVILAIDAMLTVSLQLPDGELTTKAVVLNGGTVHRLRFVELTKEDLTRLVKFCRPEQTWSHTLVV